MTQQLPDHEPRCAGRADRAPFGTCAERETCLRFQQLQADRQDARLDAPPRRAFTLPRVGKNDCHFRVAVPALKKP